MFLSFIKKDCNPVDLFIKISSKYSNIDVVDIFMIVIILQNISLSEFNKRIANYKNKNKTWDIKSFLRDNPVSFLQPDKEDIKWINSVVKLKNADGIKTSNNNFRLFLYLFWSNPGKFKDTEVNKIIDNYLKKYDNEPFDVICGSTLYFKDIQKYLKLSDNCSNIITINSKDELKKEILKAIIYNNSSAEFKFIYKDIYQEEAAF